MKFTVPMKLRAYWAKYRKNILLYASFGIAIFKSLDYRRRWTVSMDKENEIHDKLDEEIRHNKELAAVYNDVLVRITSDTYEADDIKLPFWWKVYHEPTKSFRMVKFNRAYEEKHVGNASEYFGKIDSDLVGELGEEWQRHDMVALKKPGVHIFFERYIEKETGKIKIGKFAKWRVDKPGGIYIYGIQIE